MTFEAFPDRRPPQRLPVREPQAALHELVPEQPAEPLSVNLFGVPAGEVVDRCFDLGRLQRVRMVDESSEPTP
ncbi:hypothetical protein OG747_52705 (plasmid) [Streptomyces sp. NBC_01384]|uniref:hypothetical protein n=1 Tax=Streptomyces sp. NBC_01384 TaxID=2903847 RepID=UPI002F9131DA